MLSNQKHQIMYAKRNYGIMPRNFGGLLEDVFQNGWTRLNDELSTLSAPVNILEIDGNYEVHVIAPGLKKEDFKISIDRGIIHVAYDHKEEAREKEDGKWLRSEFTQKSFKRSFNLNDNVDIAKISAKYADGVLTIALPKKEKAEAESKLVAVA